MWFESEAITDSRGDECNQMVSEPFSCLLLTIFNKRLLFRWILFRVRQRVATSEQEMRAQSQYGQLPLCILVRN